MSIDLKVVGLLMFGVTLAQYLVFSFIFMELNPEYWVWLFISIFIVLILGWYLYVIEVNTKYESKDD